MMSSFSPRSVATGVRILVSTLACLACLALSACREPNTAGQCEKTPTCLTGVECSYDDAKKCQFCRCKAPFGATPQTLPPIPTPP